MMKKRRSTRATAQLLAINAKLYEKERDRQITRYRFSANTLRRLANRTAIRESFLNELEEELAELNLLLVRLPGEYAVVDLSKADSWVKLGFKRLKEADDDLLAASEEHIEMKYEQLYPAANEEETGDD
ncbi:hypothetical protein [Burkholderia pseudomallei]|uniref:hypothetical protein n=1 Tax=Burkholderia pseudomallei TaxID=28450 RepID=UPI001AAFCA47|nr:hypothetical protein [Burkholderia pseudomallei]MBO2985824.1 hypothetical protein [Burkholderia pseudomallei]MBO7918308.1 hypothetical protein [Burkholderia pseudomallei]